MKRQYLDVIGLLGLSRKKLRKTPKHLPIIHRIIMIWWKTYLRDLEDETVIFSTNTSDDCTSEVTEHMPMSDEDEERCFTFNCLMEHSAEFSELLFIINRIPSSRESIQLDIDLNFRNFEQSFIGKFHFYNEFLQNFLNILVNVLFYEQLHSKFSFFLLRSTIFHFYPWFVDISYQDEYPKIEENVVIPSAVIQPDKINTEYELGKKGCLYDN